MNSKLLRIITSTFLFPAVLCAQKLDSMMSVYATNYPQEKVYVQFDKNLYNPGETIWFKAYVFSENVPSPVSKNFYTELSDGNGNILQRKIAPLYESTAAGSYDIPADVKSNHLHFRAYTIWMMNFDTAFMYEKDIRIINKANDSSKKTEVTQNRYLQFFPEGGDLIAGLENNIAFKANDQFGNPINIKGVLKDATGKSIAEFNSTHDGMGKFLLSPDKTDVFSAVWTDDLGKEHTTDLPAVKSSGVILKAMPGNKKVFFSVSRSAENVQEYTHLSIIAHMHQFIVYKAKLNLENNFMSGGIIPTDQLPSGVLQITVFNNNDLPVAERVVFVNNHDYELTPSILSTAKSIVKRGRNEIEISVPDTLRSNFSIAITDAIADGEKPNDDNIISRLLLTGDIRGYVHDPYYYFSNSSDSLINQLDLVMLTHGWRRFKWDDLARGKEPTIKFRDQNYISANADVYGIDASKIARNEIMNVIIKRKDSSTQMVQLPRLAGNSNRFGISGLLFYDTATAFYQFNINRNLSTQTAIVFTNGLYNGVKKIKLLPYPFTAWTIDDSGSLKRNRLIENAVADNESQKVKTLATVVIKAREKSATQKLDEKYSSGLFSGGDAYFFDLTNEIGSSGYPDIFTYLQGKVAGLQITTNASGASLSWRGASPGLYLNEMQVDASQLQNVNVSDIAMVKVFRPGGASSILGGGGGGAIAVYTKKGGEEAKNNIDFKGLEHARLIGYSSIKQFYSPDYANDPDANAGTNDVRSTIYWNPYILADKSKKRITVQFYNNDISKRLRIILEGVNEEGKLTHVEKILE